MSSFARFTSSIPREYSLSTLLGVVTLASILPLLLLGIYALAQYVAQTRADQLTRLTRYTEALSNTVDRELRGFLETAEVLAASRHLAEGDIRAFGALARDAVRRANIQVALIAPSGQLLIDTRLREDTALPVTEDMDSVVHVLRTGAPVVSNLFTGPVSSQPAFVIRVPVKVGDQIRYVLSVEPQINIIHEVVQQSYLPEGWRVAVLDGVGRIVARSSLHEQFFGSWSSPEFVGRLTGQEGVIDSADLEGQPVVTSYRRSQRSPWFVAAWVPQSVLDAPTHQFVKFAIALAVLTLLASFAATLFAGRIIAGPTRQLLKAARAVGKGEPVAFEPTHMRETNVVGYALDEAARTSAAREQALRKSELHTRFVMRELSHRSKNLLSIIQAIARQTGRTSQDIDDFNERFGQRLTGLGRSQDLLVQKNWEGVSMSELAAAQLAAFMDNCEPRVATNGPHLLLNAEAAQSLGMALHELATNASKHGALAIPSGRVSIDWTWRSDENGDRYLQVRWKESDGPEVKPPSRKGFGHSVIERLTAASLHGTAELHWRPEGLVWTLDVPESKLSEAAYDRLNSRNTGDAAAC